MKNITYGEAASKQGINIPAGVSKDDKIYGIDLQAYTIYKNGVEMSNDSKKNLSIGDLLSGKYVVKTDDKSNYEAILKAVADALGYNESYGYKGLNIDPESNDALKQAMDFSKLLANVGSTIDTKIQTDMVNTANNQNNLVKGQLKEGSTYKDYYFFSLTNLVKSYLTNYAIAIEGFECDYGVDSDSVKKSNYVTNDPEYYFLLKKDSAMTDSTMLNADFYNMLFNQIATQGAIADTSVQDLYSNDKSNLQQALKNGTLFISAIHNDGYYYQGAYTLSGHVAEVTDEDAIARAEIEYNVQKAKLNHKEETLDLQMKNLDMEISSLTTEMDSVKNLISKGVEKVFTMFSS